MKVILSMAATFAAISTLTWMIGSFMFADFNIAHWAMDGRVLIAVIGVFFAGTSAIFVGASSDA